MRVSKEELVAVLAQFNPWWRGEAIADLPKWRRAAFRELHAKTANLRKPIFASPETLSVTPRRRVTARLSDVPTSSHCQRA